jgi:hypothetical protein
VLVVGGGAGRGTGVAELYDPVAGAFVPAGETHAGRYPHSATLLRDGRVLVVTGWEHAITPAELYDPATGTWSGTGGLRLAARADHTATRLDDGRVLVTGGCCADDAAPTATAEIYDPSTGDFTLLEDTLSHGSAVHTAVRLEDGRVWISTGDVFDPQTDSFSPAPEAGRGRHDAVRLADGSVLAIGGFVDYDVGTIDSVIRFDANLRRQPGEGTLIEPRQGHTATVLADGRVLVVGGGVGGTYGEIIVVPLASAELYLP